MVETGQVLDIDQPTSDAETIGLIRWEADTGCERFTIELVTAEGAPATTPPSVTVELIRNIGILRVNLGLQRTAVTDQLVETALVGRYYVARELDQSLFVDFHLSGPAVARASVNSGPGTVVVELEPGGGALTGTPAIGDLVVLTSPLAGASAVPVLIEGYGRPFEASVVYWFEQDSTVFLQETTNSADYSETWGSFSTSADPGISGEVQLFVGQLSAEDGSPRGVTVDLVLP
jgi:Immunoglobulin-like domain of bacterial spore germination